MRDEDRPLFQSTSGDSSSTRPRRAPILLAIAGVVVVVVSALGYRALRPEPQTPAPIIVTPPSSTADVPGAALDGVMVRIPGGTFKLGALDGDPDERPIVDARVAAFEIDTVEVSVDAYRVCVSAAKCEAPDTGNYCNWGKTGKERHPVNCVDAVQAEAYCAFVGKRLPTEDEWDYAARGADGRKYPWKDGLPGAQLCWNGEGNDVGKGNRQGTCPVGHYPSGASPFGALDMVGNVWEWTSSAYCPYDKRGCDDPRRVIRGGGWNNLVPEYVRAQDRSKEAAKARNDNIGLRCARSEGGGAR